MNDNEELREQQKDAEIERLTDDYAAATHLLADRDAQIERLTALNSALTDKSNSYLVENARLDRELAAANAVIERLTAELATLRASAASVQADQRAEIDAANAVIDELLACDDLRTRAGKINPVEPGYEKDILMDEYRRRNRVVWNAARALRKGTT